MNASESKPVGKLAAAIEAWSAANDTLCEAQERHHKAKNELIQMAKQLAGVQQGQFSVVVGDMLYQFDAGEGDFTVTVLAYIEP